MGNAACPCDPHASSVRRRGIQDEWQQKEVDSAYKLPPQFSPLPSKTYSILLSIFDIVSEQVFFIYFFVELKFNVVTCCK